MLEHRLHLTLLFTVGCLLTGSVASAAPVADVWVWGYSDAWQVGPGEIGYVTVQVGNAGPDPATGLQLVVDVPPGATLVAAQPEERSSASCASEPTQVTCTFAAELGMWDGFYTVFSFRMPADVGTFDFGLHAAAVEQDPDLSSNSFITSLEVVPPTADLVLWVNGWSKIARSQPAALVVAVSNWGPTSADAVTVAYSVPQGATLLAFDPACALVAADHLRCTLGSMAPGAYRELPITLGAPETLGVILTSVASVASDTPDPNPDNNQGSLDIEVVEPAADLGIALWGPQRVDPSGEATITVYVANNGGPTPASGVTVRYAVPQGAGYVSNDAGCTLEGAQLSCAIGNLGVYETRMINVVLTAPETAGTMTSSASVASDTPDPNSSDNETSLDITVRVLQADLRIGMGGPSAVAQGAQATFRVVLVNQGPDLAQRVTVRYTVPDGASYVSNDSGCAASGTQVTCLLGDLRAGFYGRRTINIVIQASVELGMMTSTASVTSGTPDPDSSNNEAQVDSQVVVPMPDLWAWSYTDAWGPLACGAMASVTVEVGNWGTAPATGATLTMTIPAGASLVSAVPEERSGGSCVSSASEITCTFQADLAPFDGFYTTFTFMMFADGDFSSHVATGELPDADPGNNDTTTSVSGVDPSCNPFDQQLYYVNTWSGYWSSAPIGTATHTNFFIMIINRGRTEDTTLDVSLPGFQSAYAMRGPYADGPVACHSLADHLVCDLGNVADSVTYISVFGTAPVTAGTYPITATVTSATPDPDPSNNTYSMPVEVIPALADLATAGIIDVPTGLGGSGINFTAVAGEHRKATFYVRNILCSSCTDATSVTLRVTLPEGLTNVAILPQVDPPTTCSRDGNVITCTMPYVWSQLFWPTALVVLFDAPSSLGDYVFAMHISADTPEFDPTNNDGIMTLSVIQDSADLRFRCVLPLDQRSVAEAGSVAKYMVEVQNAGPTVARNRVLTITAPENAAFDDTGFGIPNLYEPSPDIYSWYWDYDAGWGVGNMEFEPGFECTLDGRTMTCALPDFMGLYGKFWVVVRVRMPAQAGDTVTLTARVSSDRDPDVSNNSGTFTTTVVPAGSVDVVTLPTEGTAFAVAGDPLIYAINFYNHGPLPASNVVVTATLPEGAVVQDVHPEGAVGGYAPDCAVELNIVSCTIPWLDVSNDYHEDLDLPGLHGGQGWAALSYRIVIWATAPEGDPGPMVATVRTTSPILDRDASNDSVTIITERMAPSADMVVSQGALPPSIFASSIIEYDVSVQNLGPTSARDVLVIDTMSPGMTAESAYVLKDSATLPCIVAPSIVSCDLGWMQSETGAVVVITARTPSYATTITNTAVVSSSTPDPNPGNGTASSTTHVVVPKVDLDIELASKPPKDVIPGAPVSLSWRVHNRGDEFTATGVTLTLAGPESACPSPDGCARALDPLAPGASTVVQTVVVAPAARERAVYKATVTSNEQDTKPHNNAASATLHVVAPADLAVAIAPRTGTGLVWGPESYQVTVTNTGPGKGSALVTVDTGGLDGLVAAASHGRCQIAAGTRVTCTLGDLHPGRSATVTLSGRLVVPPGGPFSATASVREASNLESNLGDNVATFAGIVTAPPIHMACQDVTVNAGAGCNAEANVDDGSSDPMGGALSCAESPTGPYALGTTQVTLTCARGSDHASCAAKVKVVDNSPPALVCPAAVSLECVDGDATETAEAQASDNCGAATVSCTTAAGGGTCVAHDAAGNRATCHFIPSVVDTVPPVVVTNADAGGISVILSPANGKMRDFSLEDCVTAVADKCDGELDIRRVGTITRITSDEGGAGSCTDIAIVSRTKARLRAEEDRLNGRVYTVTFSVVDDEGNATQSSCRVAVPRSRTEPAVADAPVLCVGTGCGTTPTCHH